MNTFRAAIWAIVLIVLFALGCCWVSHAHGGMP